MFGKWQKRRMEATSCWEQLSLAWNGYCAPSWHHKGLICTTWRMLSAKSQLAKQTEIFHREQLVKWILQGRLQCLKCHRQQKVLSFSRSGVTERSLRVGIFRGEMKRSSSPQELTRCRSPLPLLVQRFGRGLRLHTLSEGEGGSAKTPPSDRWRLIIPSQRLVSDDSGWLGREAAEIWIRESSATKRNPVKGGLVLGTRAAPSDGALLWWKETLMPLTGSFV